jgi:hypothetical protein
VPRRVGLLAALLVISYLCAAGWFFILAPWSPFWTLRVVVRAPLWLARWLDAPALRGALSAFGVLHFPAAVHWLAVATRRT